MPVPLYPEERDPSISWGSNSCTHWIGSWVDPRAGLDDRKNWTPVSAGEVGWTSERYEELNILDHTDTRTPTPLSSSPKPVAIPTALPSLMLGHARYKVNAIMPSHIMWGCFHENFDYLNSRIIQDRFETHKWFLQIAGIRIASELILHYLKFA
jgi:hypothetical protein